MRKAFVMGSNGSKNLSPLQYALEDARRIKACFESPRCGFEVTLLESERDPFEIRRKLYNIAESCTPHDTFICYFAGHGILERGSLFLFLDKTEISRLGTTSIPIPDVLQAFQYCQAHNKLLVLDCCHAGAAVNATGLRSPTEQPVKEIIHPDNHLVLMASDRFEKARELDTLKGGFLTANICAALGEKFHEADKTGDSRLSLQDLMQWLKERAIAHNAQYPDKKVPYPYTFGQERGDFFLTVDGSEWIPYEIPWHDGSTMVVLPIYPQSNKAFCISKHPVTNEQYRKFVKSGYGKKPIGENFYKSKKIMNLGGRGKWKGDFHPWQTREFDDPNQPVVCVSYQEALQYCNWVTDMTPIQLPNILTQLPSVRLWDFAALGTEFRTSNPDTWLTQSREVHHDSTSPAPIDLTGARWNDRGISDMFGNVWEWCSSNDSGRFFVPMISNIAYVTEADDDNFDVELRGGGFLDNLTNIEPFLQAYRLVDGQNTRHSDLGFRTATNVDIENLPDDINLRLSLCKRLSNRRSLSNSTIAI
jgi:formylglycine-generating enzyme required for sulfatase activity